MKSVLNWFVLTLLLFLIFGAGALSLNEATHGNVCPKLFVIPACYIVVVLAVISLLAHLHVMKLGTKTFYSCIGIIAGISLTGTIGEFAGFAQCPPSSSGIPMCYYALGVSAAVLILKWIEQRK